MELDEVDPEAGVTLLRLFLVRDMIHHREISLQELADEMDCTTNWLGQILTGRLALRVQDYVAQLDRVEDAITVISDRRGVLCPCSASSYEDVCAMLSVSAATREAFGGYAA